MENRGGRNAVVVGSSRGLLRCKKEWKVTMKKTLITLIAIAALSVSANAQFPIYGLGGAGYLMQNGESGGIGVFGGFETPIATDDSTGHVYASARGGVFYSNFGDEDIQAGFLQGLGKTWPVDWLYAGIGAGYTYEVNDAGDDSDGGLKFEFGGNIKGRLGLAVGVDYNPFESGAQYFPYLLIDLSP